MGWSANAIQPGESPLSTMIVDGRIELMEVVYRDQFHKARDQSVVHAEASDPELYCGGLGYYGSGRVLSLLAGHGGSLTCMNSFSPGEVEEMSHGSDILDPQFVVSQLLGMGFTPDDPLSTYFWSTVEFVRACASLKLGIACHRN